MSYIRKNKRLVFLLGVFTILLFAIFFNFKYIGNAKIPKTIEFWEFEDMVKKENVATVNFSLQKESFVFYDKDDNVFITGNPRTEDFKKWLYDNKIKVKEIKDYNVNYFSFLFYGVMIYFTIKMLKIVPKTQTVKNNPNSVPNFGFDNIAGYEETKKNMEFIVKALKNPDEIIEMGARLPKGIILYGPPGTGKTNIAKAIAGTVGVPFYSINGSEFVEMYVGVGAKRVRELYAEARKNAPSIVFIDEIDSIGKKRANNASNDEKNDTINALLSELDGFRESTNVITIGATNRLEDLDKALIRPGRFDRKIAVPLPDKNERTAILEIHSKNKKLDKELKLEDIAKTTVGFSGASLESLLNESAIIAVLENSKTIKPCHIDKALFNFLMEGEEKRNSNNNDLEIIAYHEAGHVLASKLLTDEEIPKVTIIGSTSGAGGVTFRNSEDKILLSKKDIENSIQIFYGGRASEEIYFGNTSDITTGASNDIEQATRIIKSYLSHYGMNDNLGLLNIDELSANSLTKLDSEVFMEAKILSEKMYCDVLSLLKNNSELLRKIANELLKNETLTNEEINNIIKTFNII